MREPQERDVEAGGLRHRVYEWDGGGRETTIFLHGFLDHARTWDLVVDALPPDGHYLAFDFRGHGRTEWVGRGATYHFAEYVLDLADVIDAVARATPRLVGHSMGGGVAAYFTGAHPGRVASLALMEGLGPPAGTFDEAPERHAAFVAAARRRRARERRPVASLEEAAARLRAPHPRMTREQALWLARHATREQGGALEWRHDPMHRVPFAKPFYLEQAAAFWRRVRCPVLLLEGSDSHWAKLPDLDERRAAFARATWRVIDEADHMMHVEQPRRVARALVEFWGER